MTIYKDQLEAVYKLIEKPEKWTQEYFARDAKDQGIDDEYDVGEDGEPLNEEEMAMHPDAQCWCLIGAAYKCGISDDMALAQSLGFKFVHDVAEWNDAQYRQHAEVLELLRQAIERAPVRP